MPSRWITLVLALYVSLDLANPMMPGAVQLVGASLETVDGCQCRTSGIATPAVPTASLRHLSTVSGERDTLPRPLSREVGRRSLLSSSHPRHSLASESSPASPTGDD